MMTALTIVGTLVLFAGGSIVLQNSKPQVAIGMVDGKFQEISTKPNCVSTQTAYEDKRIEPLPFKDSMATSKDAIKAAFEAYGDIEIVDEKHNYIYAIATTGTMKYRDDIEVYFSDEEKVVHYRSSSRAGYSDMGLNKERFDAIAKVYEDQ